MPRRFAISWNTVALELVIVFVGLFAALQADEWRDRRELERAQTEYLERLADDLSESLRSGRRLARRQAERRDAVRHVHESLQAGRILDDDTLLFEEGLLRVYHLPGPTLLRATYDEMVASGMYTRLRSRELKQAISSLYGNEADLQRLFVWWREGASPAVNTLDARVEFYNEPGSSDPGEEPAERARFDFQRLARDTQLRNQFFWAADTHDDWVRELRSLVEQIEEADSLVALALADR